jgi:GNAT superfamily N-acetyltransferase
MIRPAQERDGEGIVDLIAELRRDDNGVEIDRGAVGAVVRAALADGATTVLVAELAAAVTGFIVVHWLPFPMLAGTEAYISDLIVARDQRGHGAGRRLVEAVEDEARRRGCVRLMLNNRKAAESFQRAFYPKLGYRLRDDFGNFVKPLR